MPNGSLIRVGDRIKHHTYGEGIVLKIWRSGYELVAKVKWSESNRGAFAVVIGPQVKTLYKGDTA